MNWYKTIKAQGNIWDSPFSRTNDDDFIDPSVYYNDLDLTEKDRNGARCGRRVCWLSQSGDMANMIKLTRDQVYAREDNEFERDKYISVINKINNSEDIVYFYAPYGTMNVITFDDVVESIESERDGYNPLSRALTTGDSYLDEFLATDEYDREDNYDEDEIIDFQDSIASAIAHKEGDIGNMIFKIRDGNHRAFGAFDSGEPYIWASVFKDQYRQIQTEDVYKGYKKYFK